MTKGSSTTSCLSSTVTILAMAIALSACQKNSSSTVAPSETPTDPGSPSNEINPPTVGSTITFSNIASTTLTVSWGAATDDASSASALEYKLVKAGSSTAIDTVAEVEAVTGGDLLLDWTAATTSVPVTGLTPNGTTYFAVVVRDEAGKTSLYAPQFRFQGKMIYVTTVKFSGNLGGISGADQKCADNKPTEVGPSTVKALLVDGVNRVACSDGPCSSSTDWVLAASTNYYNTQHTLIGTTNAQKVFATTSAAVNPSGSTWVDTAFTGMSGSWVTSIGTCQGWTSGSASDSGEGVGHTNFTNTNQFIASASSDCDNLRPIICVEQ